MKEKLMEEGLFSVLMNDGGEEVDPVTGEKVVKTEEPPEETSEEETPPPEKKEGEETPPPSEGVKPEVDEFGVPYKNRAKEYERKLRETEARLQEKVRELEERGKQEKADDLEAFLKEREGSEEPLSSGEIKKLTNLIGERVTRSVARIMGPMVASQPVIERQINRLKGQDGFEPKAEVLLRSKLYEVPPGNLVNDPEGISNSVYDMALGQLAREGKLGVKPKPTKRTPAPGAPVIESPGTPPAQRGKKPFTEHEKAEAERMNITPETYRAVQEKREKAKKEREKK